MRTLESLCRYVRSKNAGPFWITVDLFFLDADAFQHGSKSEGLSAERLAAVFDVSGQPVKWFEVPELNVIKFSYPRSSPQGGVVERDMHGGQQFVRLLGLQV